MTLSRICIRATGLVCALLFGTVSVLAEDGHDAWLRYAPLPPPARAAYSVLPSTIVVDVDTEQSRSAAEQLQRGLGRMLGRTFTLAAPGSTPAHAILLTTRETLPPATGSQAPLEGSFALGWAGMPGRSTYRIEAADPRGELYGAFHLLELIASERPLPAVPVTSSPSAPVRWADQWDNFDGSIERGYAGRSIFFEGGHVRADLAPVGEYGRLLASVGINGLTINNVNAGPRTLDSSMLREMARVADALRPWGVRMSLSVPFASPQLVGALPTSDPLNPQVAAWWQHKVDEIYTLIPDFGGFMVKADSEGQPGPHMYGRSPADYANMLARALAPHHGLVLYRAFVYNHHLDWRDLKADRARAAYDIFHPLDGSFDANVILQIKEGPIDFQVREPVSPLFAGLRHTSEAIETETTQEYTGQQRHMVFLVPMWKWVLDTNMHADDRDTPVSAIVEGRAFHQPTGGFVSVVNVGRDANWLYHPMALANLYGFGRLAWDPGLSAQTIVDTWTRMTFGNDAKVDRTIDSLQLESWHAYEQYTGPMGIGTLTDILGPHYGPGVGSAEDNGWGQWFRATHAGVGMDRTVATGTGFIGQYPPQLAAIYESLVTCPDDLLLFMHHVPYTYHLHAGPTVIQSIYNDHYEGAATAATYAPRWQTLQGRIDQERYAKVLALLQYQAGHAIVWRDAVSEWFLREFGIPDQYGRVGHYPGRIEAESMRADGYTPVEITPAETASGGKAVVCPRASQCTLTTTVQQPAGMYRIAVGYFHTDPGASTYRIEVNGQTVAAWNAADLPGIAEPWTKLDGQTATRYVTAPVRLAPGNTLTLTGTPGAGEPAPVDYIAIEPEP